MQEGRDEYMTAPEVLREQVREELADFGISCTEEQARLLVAHLSLVIEKNKVVNLTRITDPADAVTLHIVDSLLPLAVERLGLSSDSSFVDIGTGAGYPGIPLGVMTGAEGLLLDSVGKKVAAVSEFIHELGLTNLTALHTRVEDLPTDVLGVQDCVVARAVAQSNVLVEYATPLLSFGGLLVLEKAHVSDEEYEAAKKASKLCGLSIVSRETFELPREMGYREILVFAKTGEARVKLPRKAGMAKKEPLGL